MQLLRSYRLLVTWQALRKKNYLPLMMAVQTLFTLGIVLGYPLLFPTLDRTAIYLIATGAPAISMLSVGLVALPQTIGEQKTEGSLAYMRSLPVPRLAYLAADLTVWLAIVIPGVVLGRPGRRLAFRPGPAGQPAGGPGGAPRGSDVRLHRLRDRVGAAVHADRDHHPGDRRLRVHVLAAHVPAGASCRPGSR